LLKSMLIASAAVLGISGGCIDAADAPPALAPPRVFPHRTVEQAWKTAAAKKRPLVVMFTAAHCTYCEKMLADTYAQPSVERLLADHAETALASAEDYPKLVERLGVRAYPTILVVSGEGKIVDAVEGYMDPVAFVRRIGPHLLLDAAGTPAAPENAVVQSAEP